MKFTIDFSNGLEYYNILDRKDHRILSVTFDKEKCYQIYKDKNSKPIRILESLNYHITCDNCMLTPIGIKYHGIIFYPKTIKSVTVEKIEQR